METEKLSRNLWQPKEDAALKLATEQGLSIDQIVDSMNEDDELNYRSYTHISVRNRRLRIGLRTTRKQRNICLKKTQLASKQNCKAKNWQPKEDAALKLATEQGLSIYQIVDSMNEDDELNYRWYTYSSIKNRRMRMKLGKPRYSPEREESILKCKKLLMEVGQSLVHYNNSHNITVKCNQCNHEWVKLAHKTTGCSKCSGGFKHPEPLAPGIFYYGPLLDSPLNDLKLGVTLERIGVKERSKKYGKFEWKEIHKPIGEVEEFEREMKIKYDKYCTHNPMLKGNGSTECFDLIILPKLEKDIKEWLK